MKLITLGKDGDPGHFAIAVYNCPGGKTDYSSLVEREVFQSPATSDTGDGTVDVEVFVTDDFKTILRTAGFTNLDVSLFDLFWDRIKAKMWALAAR
ncbi:MAG: hypothetical protein FJZ01_17090 [Candidatus Sericytochromatia bacterium]|nr:hypothetical protein [Candidatus Tanganyikabacteria bacterium]